MSVARRLISSFGASILGPVVTIFVQVINVPVMLRSWGPQLYGEWLLLSAIPTYLLLSDMGFGNVAGSDMTMRVHAGDTDGALETFQSTQALVLLATMAMLVLLVAFFTFAPVARIFHLSSLSPSEARTTLFLLSINCLVIMQWSVIMSGYRSTGHYAVGMLYVNCIRIVEGASIFIVLFSKARPQQLAALMLLISVVGTGWLMHQHRRRMPWLLFGFRFASWSRVKDLAKPAFAYMAFPACGAISTQGMTLVAGLFLGPVAVAIFNPMRTLSRVSLQLTDSIKSAVWPELSAAFGRKDLALGRRLHRSAFQASMLLALAVVVMLAFMGRRIFMLWTHHRLPFDAAAFNILLAVAVANAAWNASSSAAMSANRHERISKIYLGLSIVCIGLACVLTPHFGLRGAALAMMITDLGMSLTVVHVSNSLLSDTFAAFARSMFDFSALQQLAERFMPGRSANHDASPLPPTSLDPNP